MKMIFALAIILMFSCNPIYSQEWVAIRTVPPIVEVSPIPTVSYSNQIIVQQPRPMVYQWVPYVVQQPVLTEQKYMLFCRKYVWTTQPHIQWVYQLSYVNP